MIFITQKILIDFIRFYVFLIPENSYFSSILYILQRNFKTLNFAKDISNVNLLLSLLSIFE